VSARVAGLRGRRERIERMCPEVAVQRARPLEGIGSFGQALRKGSAAISLSVGVWGFLPHWSFEGTFGPIDEADSP